MFELCCRCYKVYIDNIYYIINFDILIYVMSLLYFVVEGYKLSGTQRFGVSNASVDATGTGTIDSSVFFHERSVFVHPLVTKTT